MMEYTGVKSVKLINTTTGETFDFPVAELTHELNTVGAAFTPPVLNVIRGEIAFSRRLYANVLRLFQGLPLRPSRRAARRAHHRKLKHRGRAA